MSDSNTTAGKTFTVTGERRWLWLIVIGALVIRLVFVLVIDTHPNIAGGDTPWLLTAGRTLLDGTIIEPPQTGPVYLIYDGLIQGVAGNQYNALQMLRALNAVMGAALCSFVYLIGRRYLDGRVGLIAALAIAVDPTFIIEAGNVFTESVFLLLLFGALALYALRDMSAEPRSLIGVGLLLGLATLTRAVSLLLPIVLLVHLVILHRRAALRLAAALLIPYILIVSTWTIYNLARWGVFVIGAQGVAANLYIGTTNWCGPSCIDQSAGITTGGNNQTQYVQGTLDAIRANPIGYALHRVSNLLDAELQPYNTVYYGGESVKAIVADWWASGHSLAGLGRVFTSDQFWPKLALYVFHYAALFFGAIGLLIGLRRLFARLPIYGTLGYFLALHLALTAIPRYLLPIEPIWWLFAAFALVAIGERIIMPRKAVPGVLTPGTR